MQQRAPSIYTTPVAKWDAPVPAGQEAINTSRWGMPANIQQGIAQANQQQAQPQQPNTGGGGGKTSTGQGRGGDRGIGKYLLSDEDYQNTVNDLTKNFQNYRIQNQTNTGNLRRDYTDTTNRMATQRAEDFRKLQAQFAARGLFGSGEYEGDRLNFDLDWQNQQGDAQTSYNRNLSQLMTDLSSMRSLFKQQLKDAKLSALRRRAEQLGIRS